MREELGWCGPRHADRGLCIDAELPAEGRRRRAAGPWARREEWRHALATLVERHSAKACAGAGIAPEDIGDTLGEYAASNLLGAAFEDLLASDLPDGRNIAEH